MAEPRASGARRLVWAFGASLGNRPAHAWSRARGTPTAPLIGIRELPRKAREEREIKTRITPPPHHHTLNTQLHRGHTSCRTTAVVSFGGSASDCRREHQHSGGKTAERHPSPHQHLVVA